MLICIPEVLTKAQVAHCRRATEWVDGRVTAGAQLAVGDPALYPSTGLHLQSMVRGDNARTMLFDLDQTIQELAAERGVEDPACVRLTGIYHNRIRYWVDA